VNRRTGALLLVACLTACATSPDVISTGAESNSGEGGRSTSPTDGSVPVSPSMPSNAPPISFPPVSIPGEEPYANGIGDSLFPSLGNPGIDVEHYTLALQYDHERNEISATAHLDIVMTEDRDAFSLDSDGPVVSAVTVDGTPADFRSERPELIITPALGLTDDQRIAVDITYTLSPQPVPSAVGDAVGWYPTPGGSYVLNEPEGARTWIPCDDHPSDKATFRFELTVPTGVTAVANGALVDHTSTVSTDTWTWQEDRPMATYLIQLLTGDYELVDGVGPDGLPLLSVVLRKDREKMEPYLETIDEQVDFFDDFFGPYPLDRYGIAIVDSYPGLAMESIERSQFSREDFSSGRLDYLQQRFLSHELAHQWFGDAVTPSRWKDVWLNESFATYAEWMWLDHVGLQSIESSASAGLSTRAPWSTASPRADQMFGFNSYDGGAVILHALRKTIGDELFFTLLRRWVADNNGSSRSTNDFVDLANDVSGQDLTEFFATWLYADTVPTMFPS
jgi:aminopeptidase N